MTGRIISLVSDLTIAVNEEAILSRFQFSKWFPKANNNSNSKRLDPYKNIFTHIRPRATSNTLSWNMKSVKSSHVCFARLLTVCPDRSNDSRPSSTRDIIFKFEVSLIERNKVDNLKAIALDYVGYGDLQIHSRSSQKKRYHKLADRADRHSSFMLAALLPRL